MKRSDPGNKTAGKLANIWIGARTRIGEIHMRTLREIAKEIASDWKVIKHAGALDALECMKGMGEITEPFYAESNGYSVITAFLSGAEHGWRGEVARRVKKELRVMCGHPRP